MAASRAVMKYSGAHRLDGRRHLEEIGSGYQGTCIKCHAQLYRMVYGMVGGRGEEFHLSSFEPMKTAQRQEMVQPTKGK